MMFVPFLASSLRASRSSYEVAESRPDCCRDKADKAEGRAKREANTEKAKEVLERKEEEEEEEGEEERRGRETRRGRLVLLAWFFLLNDWHSLLRANFLLLPPPHPPSRSRTVGSSRKSREGLDTISMPTFTRLRCPPLMPRVVSSPMGSCLTWARPRVWMTSAVTWAHCAFEVFLGRRMRA